MLLSNFARVRNGVLPLALLAGLLAVGAPAQAQPAEAQTGGEGFPYAATDDQERYFSVNIAGATDYRFRGFTQTRENPAVQGGGDFAYEWFYAGVWATNVDFGSITDNLGRKQDIADYEIDLYAGAKKKFGTVELEGGFIYYAYPDSASIANLDYYEFYGGASTEFHKSLTAGLMVYYSPDYFGGVGRNWIIESSMKRQLHKFGDFEPSIVGTLAYSGGDESDGGFDYWYWNAGFSVSFHDYFEFDLRYFDTFDMPSDISCKDICDGAVVAMIKFER